MEKKRTDAMVVDSLGKCTELSARYVAMRRKSFMLVEHSGLALQDWTEKSVFNIIRLQCELMTSQCENYHTFDTC